jgi:hypothetical protein
MSSLSNKCIVRRPAGAGSAVRLWFLLLSLLFLCQSCSSNIDRKSTASVPGNNGDEQGSRVQHTDSPDAPRIALDRTTYDFGEMRPQSKGTATFRLTNAGQGTLKITNVQKCCGAVIKLDKKDLAAGESGVLTAEYAAGPMVQELSKKIRLFTNDPANPQVELNIVGKVLQTLVWTPTRFELAAYEENVVCPEITIKSTDGRPFAIKSFNATGQCLATSFDPNTKASQFTLKPKVDRAKLDALASSMGRIKIDVAHRDYEAIYLDFEVKPVFETTPPRILVVNAEPGQAVLRTLQLQDRRANASSDVAREIESVKLKKGTRVEVRGVTSVGHGCQMNLALWPAGDRGQ